MPSCPSASLKPPMQPSGQRHKVVRAERVMLSGSSVDDLVGGGVHVHPPDFGIFDAVGARAGGLRMTTKPAASKCCTSRSAVTARRSGGLSMAATLSGSARTLQEHCSSVVPLAHPQSRHHP